ncbi:hypothetical protein ABZP36_020893 [Zizania latifolia]
MPGGLTLAVPVLQPICWQLRFQAQADAINLICGIKTQIILTHEHAGAILGLDDVRVVQAFSPTNDIDPTPIYLS